MVNLKNKRIWNHFKLFRIEQVDPTFIPFKSEERIYHYQEKFDKFGIRLPSSDLLKIYQ